MTDDIAIAISGVIDGSMSKNVDEERKLINKRAFLTSNGMSLEQSVLVHLTYEGDDYKRYYTIGSDLAGDGMTGSPTIVADALFTQDKNLALFLPIADCVAVVMYDPIKHVLGLSHLGRHNLLQQGGTSTVMYMVEEFATVPSDLRIWLSPAAGREKYPLYDFDNRSLHEVATEQLRAAGVSIDNMTIDARDTTADNSLFSYSEFLKGNRPRGTQAVVAMMRS